MNLVTRAKTLWKLLRGGNLTRTDKIILALTVLYCLSPLDIIPDFVPVVGFLDDLLIVLAALRHLSNDKKPASTADDDAITVDATTV